MSGNPTPIPLSTAERSGFIAKCARVKVQYGVGATEAKAQATQLIRALELVRTTPEFFSAYYRAVSWLGASLDGGDGDLLQTRVELTEVAEKYIEEDSNE